MTTSIVTFSSLPMGLLLKIGHSIDDPKDLCNFGACSKKTKAVVAKILLPLTPWRRVQYCLAAYKCKDLANQCKKLIETKKDEAYSSVCNMRLCCGCLTVGEPPYLEYYNYYNNYGVKTNSQLSCKVCDLVEHKKIGSLSKEISILKQKMYLLKNKCGFRKISGYYPYQFDEEISESKTLLANSINQLQEALKKANFEWIKTHR